MKIEIKKVRESGIIPQYATDGSVGLDLHAAIDKEVRVSLGESVLVPTGIAINISDPNVAAYIYPRSGLGAKHGIVLGNLTGVIDADYQGEIMVCLWNRNTDLSTYTGAHLVTPGERIAQMVFGPVIKAQFIEVENFSETTDRGTKGFGSTGAY